MLPNPGFGCLSEAVDGYNDLFIPTEIIQAFAPHNTTIIMVSSQYKIHH